MTDEQLTQIADVADVLSHRNWTKPIGELGVFDPTYKGQWISLYLQSYADPFDYTQEDVESEWVATLSDEYGTVWEEASPLAWVDGELVGSVVTVYEAPWSDTPPGPFVIEVMVSPEYRGRGIATALLVRTAEVCKSAKQTTMALRVLNSNVAAKRLYTRLGFTNWSGPNRKTTRL